MQYLGGKSRLAKEIAAIVAPKGLWWEPFCGGLSVSVQLAKYGSGLVSDANPALIALYQAVRDGWVPPETVSEDEYREAKALPDSDPRKAFIGFGCSFGGKWFAGRARDGSVYNHGRGTKPTVRSPAKSAARAVLRDVALLRSCHFRLLSFFAPDPRTFPSCPETIYADPPYAGATGYAAVGRLDHGLFWAYCQEWAVRGVRVFVSEYACSVGADVVLEHNQCDTVGHQTGRTKVERLFRVQPPSVARCA